MDWFIYESKIGLIRVKCSYYHFEMKFKKSCVLLSKIEIEIIQGKVLYDIDFYKVCFKFPISDAALTAYERGK